MRIVCEEQGTGAWLGWRAGRCTASRMADAMARLQMKSKNGVKGDWKPEHHHYVSELAWEQITRKPADHYVSKPMDIGRQYEGEARIEYWMRYGTEVDQTGFVLHPTLDYLGSSPDGLVGTDGGAEFKVPLFHTHTAYLEADCVPKTYLPQIYTNMLCCERDWWDFVSYCPPDICPELPDEFRMFRKRLKADPVIFAEIEEVATRTMEEVIALVQTLTARYRDGQPKIQQQLHKSIAATPLTEEQAFAGAMEAIDRTEMTP